MFLQVLRQCLHGFHFKQASEKDILAKFTTKKAIILWLYIEIESNYEYGIWVWDSIYLYRILQRVFTNLSQSLGSGEKCELSKVTFVLGRVANTNEGKEYGQRNQTEGLWGQIKLKDSGS